MKRSLKRIANTLRDWNIISIVRSLPDLSLKSSDAIKKRRDYWTRRGWEMLPIRHTALAINGFPSHCVKELGDGERCVLLFKSPVSGLSALELVECAIKIVGYNDPCSCGSGACLDAEVACTTKVLQDLAECSADEVLARTVMEVII